MFLTIQEEKIQDEIVEKKSKFIATLFYVKDEEEANMIVKKVKKEYFDARHNCFAYRIMTENGVLERQSDDGEPSGTAGGPMLNILSKNNLCNVLVIVTRYFGGILLGTGGLVRAYSDAAIKVIEKATIANEALGCLVEVEIDYTQLEFLKYSCNKNNVNIVDIKYEDNIKCYLELAKNELEEFLDKEKINYKYIKYNVIEERNIRKKLVNS